MIFPFIAWAITGVFFFIKPGYSTAYERLPVKTYLLAEDDINQLTVSMQQSWLEVRYLRSILGLHLLAKNNQGWQQVDPITQKMIKQPTKLQVSTLINDAISINPQRYGQIKEIGGLDVTMTTNVTVTLDWNKMNLQQKGADTAFINTMYKIHYLQWTGLKSLDKVLGIIGLALVIILAMLGMTMTLWRKNSS